MWALRITETIHAALEAKGLFPQEHIVDSRDLDAEVLASAERELPEVTRPPGPTRCFSAQAWTRRSRFLSVTRYSSCLFSPQSGGAIRSTPRGCPEGKPEPGRPITLPGSRLVEARVERGACEGEDFQGRAGIRLVEDRLPRLPHQAGRILADHMDVGSASRNHD